MLHFVQSHQRAFRVFSERGYELSLYFEISYFVFEQIQVTRKYLWLSCRLPFLRDAVVPSGSCHNLQLEGYCTHRGLIWNKIENVIFLWSWSLQDHQHYQLGNYTHTAGKYICVMLLIPSYLWCSYFLVYPVFTFSPWVIVLHFTVSGNGKFHLYCYLEDMIHSLEFSGFVETTRFLYLSVFLTHFILFILFGCYSLHFV